MGRFNRKVNYSLRIENAFTFLCNTYPDIKLDWFKNIDLEDVKTIEDVYVIVLCRVVEVINGKGLYKEYIKRENMELNSPKGAIDIGKSVVRQTKLKGKLICSYDELSDNVLHNQLIKSVLYNMVYNKNISRKFITLIQKTLNNFNGIDIIEFKNINWKRIKFNNSNLRYKTALDLCRSLIAIENLYKLVDYTFEDKLYIMFCNHLYLFYSRNYSEKYKVSRLVDSSWTSNYKFEKLVSKSRTYVTVKEEGKSLLIIGFEKYNPLESADEQDKQLKYLKRLCDEVEKDNNKIKIQACLIYVNSGDGYTDTDIQIVNVDNKIIGYTTIDCNIKYNYIAYKLDQVINIMMRK